MSQYYGTVTVSGTSWPMTSGDTVVIDGVTYTVVGQQLNYTAAEAVSSSPRITERVPIYPVNRFDPARLAVRERGYKSAARRPCYRGNR